MELNDQENRIVSLTAIQRVVNPTTDCGGYDILLSHDIEDW